MHPMRPLMELPTKLTEISRKMLFKVTVVVKSVDQRHTNETFKTKVFVKKKKKIVTIFLACSSQRGV